MCLFVHGLLTPGANEDVVRALAAQAGLKWDRMRNARRARLREGELIFRTTQGHCDCDTALGAHRERAKRLSGDQEIELARWLDFLPAVVSSRAADRIGVFLFWDDGPRRRSPVQERRSLDVDELDAQVLLTLQQRVIYEFVSRA